MGDVGEGQAERKTAQEDEEGHKSPLPLMPRFGGDDEAEGFPRAALLEGRPEIRLEEASDPGSRDGRCFGFAAQEPRLVGQGPRQG